MSFIKYRVKEVAADFGVAPKEISDIIGKFYDRPKSYTQVLNDQELNVVFDYMTQKNQIKSLEQVFAVKPAAPKAEPAKAEPVKAAAPQQPQGQVRDISSTTRAGRARASARVLTPSASKKRTPWASASCIVRGKSPIFAP